MTRVLTASLALSMVVTLGCQEPKSPPVASVRLLPDSAEQMLFGVRFNLTDAGVRRAELLADTAFMYNDNTRTELRRITSTFFTAMGERDATLTARAGTYEIRVGTMEARGNVVVVSTDGRKLETPQLRYDPTRSEIASDSAFTLTRLDGVVQGIGFISDPNMRNFRILRGAKSFGKEVTIPKR